MFQAFWTVGAAHYFLNAFPWTIIFLLFQLFGIRLYNLKNKEVCRRLQKRVSGRCTHRLDNDDSAGFCIGRWYIANINVTKNEYGDYYNVWMVCTQSTFEKLTKTTEKSLLTTAKKESRKCLEDSTVTIFERSGSYNNCYFHKRLLKFDKESIVPHPRQKEIIENIREHQTRHNCTVAYLHGPPGTGKSFVGLLLAASYNSSYCNTLQPWIPGDFLGILYSEVEPTESSPLILVLDEVDIALEKIHKGIPPHLNIPISVPDKTGWNRFLDEINWCVYPHLILLLISNRPPSFIDGLDPAYLRKGRVNLEFEMKTTE